MVNYWFDTFKHLKPFDIIPYQDMIDLYLKNQTILDGFAAGKLKVCKCKPRIDGKGRTHYCRHRVEKLGGDNERPVNSDIEKIDEDGFWLGYNPRYYNINPYGNKVTQAKADVVSMDMSGVGETWDSFIYLELPSWLFNKYQTAVHSNRDVSYFRKFMDDVDKTDLSKESVAELLGKYDKKYKDVGKYVDFYGDFNDPAWRLDLDVGQYISIKQSGLIYPIMFNCKEYAFTRGTHRALFTAHTGSDVPFILQYPKMNGEEMQISWSIELAENFNEEHIRMKINLQEKSLKFYRGGFSKLGRPKEIK